jgi:hypothetical protein
LLRYGSDLRELLGVLPRGKGRRVGIYRSFHHRGAEVQSKPGGFTGHPIFRETNGDCGIVCMKPATVRILCASAPLW